MGFQSQGAANTHSARARAHIQSVLWSPLRRSIPVDKLLSFPVPAAPVISGNHPQLPTSHQVLEGLPGASFSPTLATQLQLLMKKGGTISSSYRRSRHADVWAMRPGSPYTASGTTSLFSHLSRGDNYTHITGDFWDK